MKKLRSLPSEAMSTDWGSVLTEVVDRIDHPLRRAKVDWSLAGSAATAIQGCEIVPRDLDILLKKADGVDALANLMHEYAPHTCDAMMGSESWVSSQDTPFADERDPEGFLWHWGRWLVGGFKVEGAYIVARDGAQGGEPGIWENGPEIWTLHRVVEFGGHRIRVPPLEVQLATCARRGLSDRVEAIIEALQRDGVNRKLLERSLSDPQVHALLNRSLNRRAGQT
ncbi:MAG: hypothetical protein L3K14_04080 [Thermoplasmata archaeon]|nr:hypothetical protein [Thermoplasmata archaeon]